MTAEHGTADASFTDVVVHLVMEDIVEAVKSIVQERIRQRVLQEITGVLVQSIQEQTVEVDILKKDVAETKRSTAVDQEPSCRDLRRPVLRV